MTKPVTKMAIERVSGGRRATVILIFLFFMLVLAYGPRGAGVPITFLGCCTGLLLVRYGVVLDRSRGTLTSYLGWLGYVRYRPRRLEVYTRVVVRYVWDGASTSVRHRDWFDVELRGPGVASVALRRFSDPAAARAFAEPIASFLEVPLELDDWQRAFDRHHT